MAQQLESFEVTTRAGAHLPFDGTLIGWEDDVQQRLVEHAILKRAGALHQDQKRGPRRFPFKCLLTGDNITEQYKAIESATAAEPFADLTHPRFGRVPVVFESMRVQEDLDDTVNTLTIQITFFETGLRDVPKASASGAAQRAGEAAAQLQVAYLPLVGLLPVLVSQVGAIVFAVDAFQAQVTMLGQEDFTAEALQGCLSDVRNTTDALCAAAGPDLRLYGVMALARLTFSRALDAYNLAVETRAPAILRRVPGRIALARWCAALYGGTLARAAEAEIYGLNRIRTPWSLPPGSEWLIPDPETVIRLSR